MKAIAISRNLGFSNHLDVEHTQNLSRILIEGMRTADGRQGLSSAFDEFNNNLRYLAIRVYIKRLLEHRWLYIG